MIIHKFIVHVLDKNSDVPILNDFEGKINPEVDKFFQKIIKRVTKDDDLTSTPIGEGKSMVISKDTILANDSANRLLEKPVYSESTGLNNDNIPNSTATHTIVRDFPSPVSICTRHRRLHGLRGTIRTEGTARSRSLSARLPRPARCTASGSRLPGSPAASST